MEEEIEVLTVRYKHALRRLQATNPDELAARACAGAAAGQRAEQHALPVRLRAPRVAAVGIAAALFGLL